MGNHFCSTIAVVTVVSVPPEVTVMGAEAAETPIATVLGVLAAELGVMVVAVEAVVRLISGLVGMPAASSDVIGLEVTTAVAALPANESRVPWGPTSALDSFAGSAATAAVTSSPTPTSEVSSASRIATST